MAHFFICSRLCLKKIDLENEMNIEDETMLYNRKFKKKNKKINEESESISDNYSSIYSVCSENHRANVRVQFSKSTDLYKDLNDDKIVNESFENEKKINNTKKINKKDCEPQASVSTNLTTVFSDSQSENKNITSSTLNTQSRKHKKLGNTELGIISEETKRNNAVDSDDYSECSNRNTKTNFTKKESNKKNLSISLNYIEPNNNKIINENSKNLSTSIYVPNSKKKEVLDKRNNQYLEENKPNLTNSKNPKRKITRNINDRDHYKRKDSFYSDESENTPRPVKNGNNLKYKNDNDNMRKKEYWESNKNRDFSRNICPVYPNNSNNSSFSYVLPNYNTAMNGILNYSPNSPLNFPIYYNPNVNPYQMINNPFPVYPQYNNPYEYSLNQMALSNNTNNYPLMNPNSSPNLNVKVQSNDGQYCSKCEEIYKQVLFNNIPLKISQCIFCNTMLNSTSLEKIHNKYNKEIEEFYKKKLSENLDNNRIESIISNDHTIDNYYNHDRLYENYNGDYLLPRRDYNYNIDQMLYSITKKNTPKNNESWSAWVPTKENKEELCDKENNTKENEEIIIGEVFKKKKKELMEKINLREISVKCKKTELQNLNNSSTPKNIKNKYKSFSSEITRRNLEDNNIDNKQIKHPNMNIGNINKESKGDNIKVCLNKAR